MNDINRKLEKESENLHIPQNKKVVLKTKEIDLNILLEQDRLRRTIDQQHTESLYQEKMRDQAAGGSSDLKQLSYEAMRAARKATTANQKVKLPASKGINKYLRVFRKYGRYCSIYLPRRIDCLNKKLRSSIPMRPYEVNIPRIRKRRKLLVNKLYLKILLLGLLFIWLSQFLP